MYSNPFETPIQNYGSLRRRRALTLSGSVDLTQSACSDTNQFRRITRFEIDPNVEETRSRGERAALEAEVLTAYLARQQIDSMIRNQHEQAIDQCRRLQLECKRLRKKGLKRYRQTLTLQQIERVHDKLFDIQDTMQRQISERLPFDSWPEFARQVAISLETLIPIGINHIDQLPGMQMICTNERQAEKDSN